MKITIDQVSNGFVLENEVYSYRPGQQAYTMIVDTVSIRKIIAPTLADVFEELRKLYPEKFKFTAKDRHTPCTHCGKSYEEHSNFDLTCISKVQS
jgi:hypothetical protein